MLLVDFKRSKRMRYFHGNEKNESPKSCMFKQYGVFVPPKVRTRKNVFPGDGFQNSQVRSLRGSHIIICTFRNRENFSGRALDPSKLSRGAS